MSNIKLIIEEREADIGNFMVGRLLPFRQKRSVGPFVFVDHMGPAQLSSNENLDVLPHPHIGLSTLTYLFEGAILHRDSMGYESEIKPGAVNWMTAGRGVVHSERTPGYLRKSPKNLHGMQIWVGLPIELEETEPSFTHIDADKIPEWEQNGVSIRLIAGEAFNRKSPVPVYSPLYFIEIKSRSAQKLNIGDNIYGETAMFILQGDVKLEGNTYSPRQLLVAKQSRLCEFEIGENSVIFIFGGEPFPEERFINWNFVSSDKNRLQQAKDDWIHQRFPKVHGETGFVPYPQI